MNPETLLSQLIQIPSEFGQEFEIGNFVEQILSQMNFSVTKQKVAEKRYNILAEKGKGKELLFFGHLDTVPLKQGWKTNPHELTKQGDKLYGLGTWDMKGGIAAFLSAVHDFEPKNFKLKLAFVIDEENISLGMYTLIKSGWLKNIKGAISPEPGFQYGLQGIAMGRIGRSVYSITIQTDGGHVYLLKDRTNAISETAKVLKLLEKIKVYHHKELGDSSLFPRFITGGTQAMTIPDRVVLEVESQMVPPQTTNALLEEIQLLINEAVKTGIIKAKVTVAPVSRPTPFCEPYSIDKNNQFVQQTATILSQILHKQPIYYYRRSVADENRVAALGIPALTIGAAGGNAHEANEWISQKSLVKLSQFFRVFLETQNKL